jgi:hypothetical protein
MPTTVTEFIQDRAGKMTFEMSDGSVKTFDPLGVTSSGVGIVLTADQFILNDTGSTARNQNTTVLQNAFASQGAVYLPPGDICHNPFVATGSPRVIGQGSGDAYGPEDIGAGVIDRTLFAGTANTILRTVHDSGAGITFQQPGVKLESIKFINLTTPAGSNDQVLVLAGPDSTRSKRADGFKVTDCVFVGGYTQLKIGSCLGYGIFNNGFTDPSGGYSLWIENYMNGDEGDPAIIGNTFNAYSQVAESAVYFKAGGGIKFVGNKINRQPGNATGSRFYKRGLLIQPTTSTSVLLVTGNSIENVLQGAIVLDCTTAGFYGNVNITGNEFYFVAGAVDLASIYVFGRNGTSLKGGNISNNVLQSCAGIRLANINGYNVGVNTHRQPSGSTLVKLEGAAESTKVAEQVYSELPTATDTTLYGNFSLGSSRALERFEPKYSFSRNVNFTGVGKNVWKNFLSLDTQSFEVFTISAKVQGSASGVGASAIEFKRRITRDSTNPVPFTIGTDSGLSKISGTITAVTPTTSDTSASAQDISMRFVSSGSKIILQLQVPSSSSAIGTDYFVGTLHVDIEGSVQSIIYPIG